MTKTNLGTTNRMTKQILEQQTEGQHKYWNNKQHGVSEAARAAAGLGMRGLRVRTLMQGVVFRKK